MKQMRIFQLCFLFLLSTSLCGCGKEEEDQVWGIASLQVISSDTIVVTDLDGMVPEEGAGLTLKDEKRDTHKKLTVKVGDTFRLTDGYHVFYTYKLVRIEDEKAVLRVTKTFDATSFGDGVKRTSRTIVVAPYSKKESSNGT